MTTGLSLSQFESLTKHGTKMDGRKVLDACREAANDWQDFSYGGRRVGN